jgi:PQQ-dependent catabolism-associated CXXCW motif protein
LRASALKGAAILAAIVLLAAPARADSTASVPEPDGVWTGPMLGPTPETLKGATVLDIAALDVLMADKPVVLDVGPADQKPADFPNDSLWLPIHRSIPGAVWMPGAGLAPLDPAREEAFFRRMEELTKGDKSTPIVAFCHPDCWGSWNAAKRLVLRGYTRVHWFPEGIDGWQSVHETAEVKPDSVWAGAQAGYALQPSLD